MIVANKENLVRGNTVLAPQYQPKEDNSYKKLKESSNKAKLNSKNKKLKNKLGTLRNIAIVFVVGVTLVGRYSVIYNMQYNLDELDSKISSLNKENDNLKVELVKYQNLQLIEEAAINKLGMVKPETKNAIYCDMNKQLFKDIKNKTNNEDKKENIFKKIASKLF